MNVLISHSLVDQVKVRIGRVMERGRSSFLCALARWGTLSGCLWLALLPWNEPVPTDRKSATGLSPVVELENEFTGDIERNGPENHRSTRVIGRSRRIVLNHTDPPFLVLCAEKPARAREAPLQTLYLERWISCCEERHGVR